MSEAQKYQGALYKEKPGKGQKKGPNTAKNPNQNQKQNPNARHQQPRVEDGSDGEGLKSAPPPPAPTPPPVGEVRTPAAKVDSDKPVNVFDYLVTDETPNASKVSLTPKEQMTMKSNAKSVFEPSDSLAKFEANPTTDDEAKNYDVAYKQNGFSYGAGGIPQSNSPPNVSTEFVTPAPKEKKKKRKEEKQAGTVSEKKRKRGQPEVLSTPGEVDTDMMDAPSSIINNAGTPMLAHSGLTGGLNRMMRSASPDDSPDARRGAYQDTSSPIKRTRRNGKEANGNGDPGLGISMKSRAERLVSSMFGGSSVSSVSGGNNEGTSKAVARTRRGSGSSNGDQLEVRKNKKSHRTRDDHDDSRESRKSKRKSSNPTDGDRPSRRLKQVDERRSQSPHGRQVQVYKQSQVPARTEDLQRELAHHFLSLVSSGSERGASVNKTLKRFHRNLSDDYDDEEDDRRFDDEKDLWRALRLRRNDRGEIVLFTGA
jgi:cell growth-regulating nucleolar protein